MSSVVGCQRLLSCAASLFHAQTKSRVAGRDRRLGSHGVAALLLMSLMLWAAPSAWAVVPTTFDGVVTVVSTGATSLSGPADAVVAPNGTIYIADSTNNQIVKIVPDGTTTVLTITGLGTPLNSPAGVALDNSGNLYIADTGNARIVKVATDGTASLPSLGSVTLSGPRGVAVDKSGNIFIGDTDNNQIVELPASGTPAVFSITGLGTALNGPAGLAFDASGKLYIADSANNRIVTVASGGTAGVVFAISGLGTPLSGPLGVRPDTVGNVYIADNGNSRIVKVTSSGAGTVLSTGAVTLGQIQGVAASVTGTVYAVDTPNNRLVSIDKSAVNFGALQFGNIVGNTLTLPYTISGSVTVGSVKAYLGGIENQDFTVGASDTCTGASGTSCAVDIKFLPTAGGMRTGSVVLYDNGSPANVLVSVPVYGMSKAPLAAIYPGTASRVATNSVNLNLPFQLALDGAGNIYIGEYYGQDVVKVPAGGGTATIVVSNSTVVNSVAVTDICGVAIDGVGNLFVADYYHSRIVVLTPSGAVSELTINGLPNTSSGKVLNQPTGINFDQAGNLLVADYVNARVVKISGISVIGTTSAGTGNVIGLGSYVPTSSSVTGVAADLAGNIYVADRNANRVIKVTPSGVASLLSPSGLTFSNPQGVTTDPWGNVYVADAGHSRIVQITTAGVASVIAAPGLTTPSTLSGMYGVTVDQSGVLWIPDWTNNRVVKVDVTAPYGMSYADTAVLNTSSDSPKTSKLFNLGDLDLVLDSDPTYPASFPVNSADSSLCAAATPLTAGNLCDISALFTPQVVGLISDSIIISNNSLNGTAVTQSVPVSGTGVVNPLFTTTPSSINFGTQPVATTSSPVQTVTIQNTGSVDLINFSVVISGANTTDFTLAGNTCTGTLTVASSCTLSFTFTPGASGARSATETISAYDSLTGTHIVTHTVALSGTGTQPVASLSPTSLSFGSVVVGSNTSSDITLTNTGNQVLTISSISTAAPYSQTSTCGATLAASGSCTITVTYSPTATGAANGTLTILSDAPTSPSTISLSGTGVQPAVTLSPTTLNLGSVLIGANASADVTLTNSGSSTLNIAGITTAAPYAHTSTCGATLATSASCTITVTFTPTATGLASGSLSIASDAPTSPSSVALSGTGIQPAALLSSSSLSLGNVVLGSSNSAAVTLTNSGTATLNIGSIGTSAPFSKSTTCGATLAAGASCSITVTFTPTATGAASGTLSIASDAPTSPATVSLSGTGTQPGVVMNPSALSFGSVVLGGSSSAAVTLTNSGTATLNVASISAGAPFSSTTTCGATLAVGSTCGITVSYTPTATGTASGALTVVSDAPTSPSVVSLSGTGIVPGIAVSTPSDFGSVQLGNSSAVKTLTVTSSGSAPLTISSVTASGDFALTTNCPIAPSALAPSAVCTVDVTFTPTAQGAISGSLVIVSNAGTSTQTLTGTGINSVPNSFSFTPVTGAELGSTQTSNAITVSGTNVASSISISSPGVYSVNGGAFTSASATVQPGDQLQVQLVTSTIYGDAVSTTLNIGGTTGTYSVSTTATLPPVTVKSSGGGAFGPWLLLMLSTLAGLRRMRLGRARVGRGVRRGLMLLGILAAGTAGATDWSPLYVGARAGSMVDGLNANTLTTELQQRGYDVTASVDSHSFSGTLYMGYEFFKGASLEVAYTDAGNAEVTLTGTAPATLQPLLETVADLTKGLGKNASLSVRYHWDVIPSLPDFYVNTRAGLYYWRSETTATAAGDTARLTTSGMGETLGAGLSYRLFGPVEAGVNADYFRSTAETHFIQVSGNLEWRFGRH